MALDVWIGAPTRLGGGPAVSFEPEAFYWFLRPMFEEFAESHGQMIDPYDGAMFAPAELVPVLELVGSAAKLVSAQDEEFDVHMGTNVGSMLEPKNEEVFHTVNREEYLAFLRDLRSAVLDAQRMGKPLVFFGD